MICQFVRYLRSEKGEVKLKENKNEHDVENQEVKEKGLKFIKDQLTFGYISPSNTYPAQIVFMVVSLIFVGISSMAVFASTTNIGWEGLSPFWQGVFIAEAILFSIQLLLCFFTVKANNITQFILLVSYFIYSIKLGFDLFLTIIIFSMDRYIYDDIKILVLFTVLLGVIVLLLSIIYVKKKFNVEKYKDKYINDAPSKSKVRKSIYVLTLPLVSVTGYIFKNDFMSLYGEMLTIFLIAVVVYYGMIIANVLTVFGIYFFITDPSFRIEENLEE